MAERAKQQVGATQAGGDHAADMGNASKESLFTQGLHALENLLGKGAHKMSPQEAFALLDQMKPQVTPFQDLDGAPFVMFFHRFMNAWYAAREVSQNHDGSGATVENLKAGVHEMIETYLDLQKLSGAAREGQDAEIQRLGPQLGQLGTLL